MKESKGKTFGFGSWSDVYVSKENQKIIKKISKK